MRPQPLGLLLAFALAATVAAQSPGMGWVMVPSDRVTKTLFWELFKKTEVWTQLAPATDDGSGRRMPVALVFSATFGGNGDGAGNAIALDAKGNVYLTGYTNARDFPTRAALQPALSGGYDAFVTKIAGFGPWGCTGVVLDP